VYKGDCLVGGYVCTSVSEAKDLIPDLETRRHLLLLLEATAHLDDGAGELDTQDPPSGRRDGVVPCTLRQVHPVEAKARDGDQCLAGARDGFRDGGAQEESRRWAFAALDICCHGGEWSFIVRRADADDREGLGRRRALKDRCPYEPTARIVAILSSGYSQKNVTLDDSTNWIFQSATPDGRASDIHGFLLQCSPLFVRSLIPPKCLLRLAIVENRIGNSGVRTS
jgi:hypothetical protein